MRRGQGCWAPAGVSLHSLYRCNPHSQPSLGTPQHTPDGTTHHSPRHTAPSPPAREQHTACYKEGHPGTVSEKKIPSVKPTRATKNIKALEQKLMPQ